MKDKFLKDVKEWEKEWEKEKAIKRAIAGIVGVIGSYIIGGSAYQFYKSEEPGYALIWGTIALLWAVLAAINFFGGKKSD